MAEEEENTRKPAARKSRTSTARGSETRKVVWTPPSSLDAPTPPDGWHYRWVRVELVGQNDMKNVSARMREGFTPVRKEEHPDFDAPVMEQGKFEGVFGVGGLILMKIPVEVIEARKEYFQAQTQGQMRSVEENLMRENSHSSMRIQSPERQSKVTFGGGR